MLVFQSALPVLLFAGHETKLILSGATDAMSKAPPIDFTKHILLHFLQRNFGIECTLDIRKRGFSSYGGGEAFITIQPLQYPLKCFSLLERGQITSFTGIIWSARQDYPSVTPPSFSRNSLLIKKVSTALTKAVTAEIKKKSPQIPLKFICNSPTPASAPGIGMLLYAETANNHRIASSTLVEIPSRAQPGSLSKQEVKARDRGVDLVRRVSEQIALGGITDEYLTDQIVIFMALATSGTIPALAEERGITAGEGRRKCEVLVGEVSLHTETAMRIAEKMLDNIAFTTQKADGGGIIMRCKRKD
jgi:RNA 3'-terminal phosphate cyclase (ATP)